MANFDFLLKIPDYSAFANAAVEAEKVFFTSSSMCAIGCRKALELAVHWVYAVDSEIQMPYKDNIQALLHEQSFIDVMDPDTWKKLPKIVTLGNLAVHSNKVITQTSALISLRSLFEFIEWIDYCYGDDYEERVFDEEKIPHDHLELNKKQIKEQASLIQVKDEEIKKLRESLTVLSRQVKEEHKKERTFKSEKVTEFTTRKSYIDMDMLQEGWRLEGPTANVIQEMPLKGIPETKTGNGAADYVLMGNDGKPLAVVEAKRTSKEPEVGKHQARYYADAIEREYGRRPMIFYTNGFEYYFWDDWNYAPRRVSGIFSQSDLQRLMTRRETTKQPLNMIDISDEITNRSYQKEAIRAVTSDIERGVRKHLLVMATGTGKTRTAASLIDVLSRGGYITNVLYLADRRELVKQAKDAFMNYLPSQSLCNLLDPKDRNNEKTARIVFSTYPTILNSIDDTKLDDKERLYTPAHFDLIVIDESHRSIFRKYKAIFDYFDAQFLGLTATPKTDVDRNTYDFFDRAEGDPTYSYGYQQAIDDGYLVPYSTTEVVTKFSEKGIIYKDLPEKDKKRFEEDFLEDEPASGDEEVPSEALNKFVFNKNTVDKILKQLMTEGIRVAGGDRIGKTIIFAQNKEHAKFIVECFDKLYPQYKGKWAARVVCGDAKVESLIDDFKNPDKAPYIAVSVDMLDTGIDVPEIVNLVFFKKVRSKTKFLQMIGRGTRLCPGLGCIDAKNGEYEDKKYFYIFDYCMNFEYFSEDRNDIDTSRIEGLTEKIFNKRIQLCSIFQNAKYVDYGDWRKELVNICHGQIKALPRDSFIVHNELRFVEKFSDIKKFDVLSKTDIAELESHISPIVTTDDIDEAAKRFDNFMYGLMIVLHEEGTVPPNQISHLQDIATRLLDRITIEAIKKKISLLQRICDDDFWNNYSMMTFENIRKEIRDLVQYIVDIHSVRKIKTDLEDPIESIVHRDNPYMPKEPKPYRERVESYFLEHKDRTAVRKLIENEPLTAEDHRELQKIFTEELGTEKEYHNAYHDQDFGIVVRSIAKMDPAAAERAFSKFINDYHPNNRQLQFIKKVIQYLAVNGNMQSDELFDPPFDRPDSLADIFNFEQKSRIVAIINSIYNNARNINNGAA